MEVTEQTNQFWQILEQKFHTNLSSSLKNCFNICGLSNANVFKNIKTEDIVRVEKFVREDLEEILTTAASNNGSKLTEIEKSCYFGYYTNNAKKFSFIHGEVMMVQEMALYVKEQLNSGESFLYEDAQSTEPKKIFENTVQTSVGIIYDWKLTATKKVETPAYNFKQKLFEKATALTSVFLIENPPKQALKLTLDTILYDDSDSNNIKASVPCVFCGTQRKITSRISNSGSTCTWNLANLKKHIISCLQTDTTDSGRIDANQNNLIALEIDLDQNLDTILHSQITIQNIKLNNSIIQNAETTAKCHVKVEGLVENISFCEVAPDGNCLFSAMAHQLYFDKIGNHEHKRASNDLRKKAVQYMKDNLFSFVHEIKGRIYERNEKIENVEEQCNSFLNDLSDGNRWGGSESLRAVAVMFQVNIIIFAEDGECYFATNFNPEFNRSIMLAYRCNSYSDENIGDLKRNHYDSVAGLEENSIQDFVKILMKTNQISSNLENENDVIYLD